MKPTGKEKEMEMSQRTAGSAMRLVRRPSRAIIVYLSMSSWWRGGGISVKFDLTFLPGGREFDRNCLEKVKSPPYAPCTPPPALAGLPLIGALCYVIFNTVLMHVENPYQV